MIMSTSQQFAKEISSLLQRVPRALLLLLKTNDCLRAIDVALGQVRRCQLQLALSSSHKSDCQLQLDDHSCSCTPRLRSCCTKPLDRYLMIACAAACEHLCHHSTGVH